MKRYSLYSAILFILVLLISGGLIIRSCQEGGVEHRKHTRIEKLKLIGKYSVNEGEYEELHKHTVVDLEKGQRVVLAGRFNRDIENEEVVFTLKNFSLVMKVNGVKVAEYGQPGSYPAIFKSAGFARYMLSVNRITREDFIEIELTYPYNYGSRSAFFEFINKITVGQKADYFAIYVTRYGLSFLMVTLILLIGFISFITSILMRPWKNRNGLRLFSFSGFVISGGIWFLMDTFYTSADILVPYAVALSTIDMINMLLLPFSGVFFVTSFFEHSETKNIASAVKLGQLICIFIIILLQCLGVKDIFESQSISVPVNSIACFLAIITACYEIMKYKNKQVESALVPLIPTALGIYADVAIHYTNPRQYGYLFRIGFIISCFIHVSMNTKLVKASMEAKEREGKLREQLTDLKVSIMLSQIQPHFLYNALNTIQYICEEDAKKAAKAIEHFAKYLRGNMDSLKQTDLIPFTKELKHLANYLYIEKLRFEDRVTIKYDLKVTDFLIPCLIIQPIVENSIRYGITRKVEGGTVNIATKENDTHIVIIISDDGMGFEPNKKQYDNRSHIGIDNVRDRLKIQCGGTLDIVSIINEGTTITIQIPKEGVRIN